MNLMFSARRSMVGGRWLLPVLVFLALIVGVGCVGAERSERAEALQRWVGFLADPAMQGRGAGTEGLAAARDFLAYRAGLIGLEPAFRDGGDVMCSGCAAGATYLQGFEIGLGVDVLEQELSVHTGDGAAIHLAGDRQEFSVLGFSGGGAFAGQAVFVGYGIVNEKWGYDSYAGDDDGVLDGCVAVAYRYEPMDRDGNSRWAKDEVGVLGQWSDSANLISKAKWAAERGAVALVVVNPPSRDGGQLKSTRIGLGVGASAIPVVHMRLSVFERMLGLAKRGGAGVVKQLQQRADEGRLGVQLLDGVTVQGEVDLQRVTAEIHNVAGYVPGRGALADELVVVGAHYDHLGYGEIGSMTGEHVVHPGADDNASGAAALIGLGELMQEDGQAERDRRGVLIAWFSGEERGLLGSNHFVGALDELVDDAQIVAMVNLDMVGRMRDRTLYVMGVETADGWSGVLEDAGRGTGVRIDMGGRAFGGSDHAAFHNISVPAIHLFTGIHDDYHRPSDTAEKVNTIGLAGVVDVVARIVERLATDHDRLVFDEAGKKDTGAGGVHGGAFLGVVPDYSMGDNRGCRLAGVSPGGPASEGGLVRGDVIVGWGGQAVKDIYDLSRMLGASGPGDVVVLEVMRSGEKLEVTVQLGRR